MQDVPGEGKHLVKMQSICTGERNAFIYLFMAEDIILADDSIMVYKLSKLDNYMCR